MVSKKKKIESFDFIQDMTTWRNDLDVAQTLRLYPDGNMNARGYKPITVVIEPGKEVQIPSEYDSAIHDVRDGVIVGGIAPLLVKVGSTDKLHPSLDVQAQREKFELEQLTAEVLRKEALEKAIALKLAKQGK